MIQLFNIAWFAAIFTQLPREVNLTTPTYMTPVPLWQKFVDPVDWELAEATFPEAPWRYYLMPRGNYPAPAWDYFQLAHDWMTQRAKDTRRPLKVRDLLELNALLMTGDGRHWEKSLRYRQPVFNYRTTRELLRVYEPHSRLFKNKDGLSLKVDGFFPAGVSSIDFFGACRALHKASTQSSETVWREAHEKFRSLLRPAVDESSEKWQVYFLTRPDELMAQLEAVLNWFSHSAEAIASSSSESRLTEVRKLAVKMQRYVDIAQFCLDGSGRTSKLVQDYVFLRFGYPPPKPVLFFAHGRAWENGTYLLLEEALRMAELGHSPELPPNPRGHQRTQAENARAD